jgi:CHRD domain
MSKRACNRNVTLASATGAALAATLIVLAPAFADPIRVGATLSGAQETPPNDSKGTGTLTATYDTTTKKLTWSVSYSGLTGPAIAAHFHGPAPEGKPAGIEVPAPHAEQNPIQGSAVLTDRQAHDLMSGLIYFNIHTNAHKAGEIRGQVKEAKAS